MAQFSYNRKYELIISSTLPQGSPHTQYKDTPLENDSANFIGTTEYTTVLTKRVTLTDHQIEFTSSQNNKTSGTDARVGNLKIYNLDKNTKALVEQVNNSVVLNVGWESDISLPLMFTGQVMKAYTRKEGENVITFLECKDGYTASTAIRVSVSIPRGSTYKDVFDKAAEIWRNNGVTINEESLILNTTEDRTPVVDQIPSQTILKKAYVYAGSLRQMMDDLCSQFNLSWQIVNNVLYVAPKDYRVMFEDVKLDSSNILSIQASQDGSTGTSNNPEKHGITVTILADARIKTSNRIIVEDGEFRGTYRVTEVHHKLSYEGTEWFSEIAGESI